MIFINLLLARIEYDDKWQRLRKKKKTKLKTSKLNKTKSKQVKWIVCIGNVQRVTTHIVDRSMLCMPLSVCAYVFCALWVNVLRVESYESKSPCLVVVVACVHFRSMEFNPAARQLKHFSNRMILPDFTTTLPFLCVCVPCGRFISFAVLCHCVVGNGHFITWPKKNWFELIIRKRSFTPDRSFMC